MFVLDNLPLLLAQAETQTQAAAPHGLTFYDYGIIAVYLIFMLALGVVFKSQSKNTSDYFRAGGAMPWWITGTSAWVAGFSAWAFVGAAGQVYRQGLNVLIVFYASLPAYVVVLFYTCIRFRRLRVVTWMEGVRDRFGHGTEQFYTWIKVPLLIIISGFALNSIGVFMSAVFHVHIIWCLIVLGVTITAVAFAGGAFAVLASDFVQMFLVMTITLFTMFLTLRQPEIGGLTGLINKVYEVHPEHFDLLKAGSTALLFAWGLAFVWVKIYEGNNMEMATMYLMAKSDKHARRMVIIPLIGSFLGPLIWIIPPMAAVIMFPHLAQDPNYSAMTEPTEAAFVVVATKLMPVGLLGLLLCAMIGATLTNMDATVNKGAGVFVRSFYKPMINPGASEKRMMVVSKLCTLAFGAIIIGVAVLVSIYRSADLFSLMNQVGMSLTAPLALPIFFGLFFRKTPQWAAWVTATACFVVVTWANFILGGQIDSIRQVIAGKAATANFYQHLPGFLQPILMPESLRNWLSSIVKTKDEASQMLFFLTSVVTAITAFVFFFGSVIFYKNSSQEYLERLETFFARLHTPVDSLKEGTNEQDEPVYRLLGILCVVYGGFVLCLMLIPNGYLGRLAFLFVGGVTTLGGLVLLLVAARKRRKIAAFIANGQMAGTQQPPRTPTAVH